MDRKNIDDLALSIMREAAGQDLSKALPPRIAYRLRHWFQRQGRRVKMGDAKAVAAQVAQKMEAAMVLKELKKNQFMARVHDDGIVKMDFGADVPEQVRKAAMSWAKRRGLKPVEASLVKKENGPYSITYAPPAAVQAGSSLLAQYVWEIPEQK